MRRKEIISVLFASILILSVFSFVSAGMLSNTFRKTQITGEVIDPVCSDSDNGKDYFTKGTIIGGGVSFVQYDYCLLLTSTGQTDVTSCEASDSNCKLHEFYCEEGIRKGVRVSCDYGCSDGICNPVPTQTSCSITLTIREGETHEIDGKTIKIEFMDATRVKMNIAGELTSSLSEGGSEELSDGKIITINDFYFPKDANETGNVTFTLPLNSCSQESICTDSDGGINYNAKGTVKWTSNTGSTNTEDYCQGNTLYETYCQYSTTQSITHDCTREGKVCSNGACVSKPIEDICLDTDGGINIYVSGKAYNPNDTSYVIKDSCQDEYYLIEASCISHGVILGEPKYCDFGCKEGRCLYANETNKNLSTCQDSDGGIEFYIQGEVKTSFSNVSSVDKCSEDGKTLVEYYCSSKPTTGASAAVKPYLCKNGCKNGACIKIQDMNKTQDKNQTETQDKNQTQNKTQEQNLNQGQSNKNLSSVDTGENCEFGCMMNEKCYPFGYRKAKQYCSDSNEFTPQTINEDSCENNFECRSNLCIDDECVNQGAFTRMMNWFKNSFGKKK